MHNLLFYRLVIFNTLALVGVYVAYYYGLIDAVIEKDISHVTEIILGLTALGIYTALLRGWKVSRSINQLKTKDYTSYHSLYLSAKKQGVKNKIILNLAEVMVMLGLVGNTVGFIVALQSEDALRAGANTAFGATAFGLLAALWMLINYWTLESTTDQHMVDVNE